jgi:hypothetical protein
VLLLLEPLHQPFFVLGIFKIGSHKPFPRGWLGTVILLISASQEARITGVSHQRPANISLFMEQREHILLRFSFSPGALCKILKFVGSRSKRLYLESDFGKLSKM